MSEHPILFSGEMVRSILEGRKTQTRRVIKPQPPEGVWFDKTILNPSEWIAIDILTGSLHDETNEYKCPYGQPGDRLWVRETWGIANDKYHRIAYKADGEPINGVEKWKPSIHLKREFSRITLEVVNVRVERVQDISEEDARREGLPLGQDGFYTHLESQLEYSSKSAKLIFPRLWNSINAKRGYGWDVNPWVWVVEFKMVEP